MKLRTGIAVGERELTLRSFSLEVRGNEKLQITRKEKLKVLPYQGIAHIQKSHLKTKSHVEKIISVSLCP
jgi:hypothetical protein